jgi:uncharacterized protein (DUF2164 family)
MGKSVTVYKEVEFDVELSDFDTEDLVEELASRGTGTMEYTDGRELLEAIYQKHRTGQDYTEELRTLMYHGLGKIL